MWALLSDLTVWDINPEVIESYWCVIGELTFIEQQNLEVGSVRVKREWAGVSKGTKVGILINLILW